MDIISNDFNPFNYFANEKTHYVDEEPHTQVHTGAPPLQKKKKNKLCGCTSINYKKPSIVNWFDKQCANTVMHV